MEIGLLLESGDNNWKRKIEIGFLFVSVSVTLRKKTREERP
jgi:hypothetical protein